MMQAPARRVLLGVILGPHGVRGLVRLKSFTAQPEAILHYGMLSDETGQRYFTLSPANKASASKGIVVARLAGVGTRDAAEKLAGQALYADRLALPPLMAPDEFYQTDLIGLRVIDGQGATLGQVQAVENYGAGDFLVVTGGERGAFDLPFSQAFVPVVDVQGGFLIASLPVGFFDVPLRPESEQNP